MHITYIVLRIRVYDSQIDLDKYTKYTVNKIYENFVYIVRIYSLQIILIIVNKDKNKSW